MRVFAAGGRASDLPAVVHIRSLHVAKLSYWKFIEAKMLYAVTKNMSKTANFVIYSGLVVGAASVMHFGLRAMGTAQFSRRNSHFGGLVAHFFVMHFDN